MPTHQSLHRAIAILRAFTEAEPALTVTEISQRLDLHKSTVSRILAVLLEEGMVWHNTATGRYSLGTAVVGMAGVALGQIDVRAAAMPHIQHLAQQTCETVAVAVRRGSEAVIAAHAPSPHSLRHVVWIGRRIPLRTTASGKVLLAAMHARGEDWRLLTAVGDADRAAGPSFDAELADIAGRGYAEVSDGFEAGTSALAAPIHEPSGSAMAAVAISGPSQRFDEAARRAAAPLVVDAADAIATELGLRARVVAGSRP